MHIGALGDYKHTNLRRLKDTISTQSESCRYFLEGIELSLYLLSK